MLSDATQQRTGQTELQTTQPGAEKAVQPAIQPVYPEWPISKRGPQTTPAPAGSRPINAIRREQVVELAYDQETGKPEEAEQPALTGQDMLKKRKERL
ncbi:hypothetical protein EPA93_33535 [Ktedonosporobacter rubrisoli]|uniref:Uncharacterized protein n=1 Tax=Ktedonosporobacter rubrisoli TaxID=2509675 RepID=A0A4P6JYS1_KTERU|nr:hypothetical protein [Ktedonosporobacter rubrisoli]QBD80633.1 hypothetical protein EPA93_33535 [Ktedonosporobacter rubrisoli]